MNIEQSRPSRTELDLTNPVKAVFFFDEKKQVSGKLIDISSHGVCALLTDTQDLHPETCGILSLCKVTRIEVRLAVEVVWVSKLFVGFKTETNLLTTGLRNYFG
jgi:hypothetical protein